MHHIQGRDRNQTLLLPNSVDEYMGPDNPVRFVDAFVEQLDLQLEAESRRNLEVMWLLRGLTPDFKTIADFRKDNRPMEVV